MNQKKKKKREKSRTSSSGPRSASSLSFLAALTDLPCVCATECVWVVWAIDVPDFLSLVAFERRRKRLYFSLGPLQPWSCIARVSPALQNYFKWNPVCAGIEIFSCFFFFF